MCACVQVKTLEADCTQRSKELREVQARLTQEEQKEEESRRDNFALKQRVLESDAGREAALKEVRQAITQTHTTHLIRTTRQCTCYLYICTCVFLAGGRPAAACV